MTGVLDVSEIKAIIFDLGRVLVNVDIDAGFFGYLRSHSPSADESISKMMDNDLFAAYNTGRLSPQEFHTRLCERFGLQHSFDEFKHLWCHVFSPMPGMQELVTALKKQFRIGLLSDTDPLHWAHIADRFPVAALFDRPTLSFQIGFRKPDRRAFWAAANAVDTPPPQCLYIDDLSVNVAGAAATGMDAVQFMSVPQLKQELAARSIRYE